MLLKPDRLNGQKIFRGVEMRGSVNHQNEMILFPPTLVQGKIPCVPLAELIDEVVKKFAVIGDKTGAVETRVRKLLTYYMKRAAINERERCRRALEKNGFKEAQHAIMGNPDG